MKVILCENVPDLGEMGDTVKVADGYARNFLIPRRLAVQSDSASAKQIEHEMRIIRAREEKQRAAMTEVARQMELLTVEIKARAGAEEKIFGSVTTAQIADGLKALGHEIDRRSIQLEEPIKSLGIYSVAVRLARGIEASIKVWVTAEEPEAAEPEPEEEPAEEREEDDDEE